jgi:hypothetical protein
MAQRIYKAASIFDVRIIGMRNLWEPSREYMGKPTEKPNYMVSVIIPKTRGHWSEEPLLANFTQACMQLHAEAISHLPIQYVDWPIKDGDVTDPGRSNAEWRKGNWTLNGTSTSPITVTIVQGGVPVPLRNRVGVKPGDYAGLSLALAVKANDPRGVKCYCNNVMFTAPGEEIVVGNSVSANDLMEQAKAQGMNVTGFGGGAPQQGFGAPPMGNGGFAPTGAPAGQTATGPSWTPQQAGGSAFPSNGPQTGFAPSPMQPPQQQGFSAPGGFTPPTGFPQRQ